MVGSAFDENKFVYVGERKLWQYRGSGWGLLIPKLDSERLGLNKFSVAKMYISYRERVVVLKFEDTRNMGVEEEVLSILSTYIKEEKLTPEELDKIVKKLKGKDKEKTAGAEI